jgi:hypothetical protein
VDLGEFKTTGIDIAQSDELHLLAVRADDIPSPHSGPAVTGTDHCDAERFSGDKQFCDRRDWIRHDKAKRHRR